MISYRHEDRSLHPALTNKGVEGTGTHQPISQTGMFLLCPLHKVINISTSTDFQMTLSEYGFWFLNIRKWKPSSIYKNDSRWIWGHKGHKRVKIKNWNLSCHLIILLNVITREIERVKNTHFLLMMLPKSKILEKFQIHTYIHPNRSLTIPYHFDYSSAIWHVIEKC